MKFGVFLFGFVCALNVHNLWAQDRFSAGIEDELEGIQSFQSGKDDWRREESKPKEILSSISGAIGNSALANINEVEQVFCYNVENKNDQFPGYTLDGFALKGSCGVLSKDEYKTFLDTFLMTEENVDLVNSEKCLIQPKIMLRFVRGIDYTDILLSVPCHSFSVFYAGKVRTFNLKPSAKKLEDWIAPLSKKQAEFVSPALLEQLVFNGEVKTQAQRELINRKNQPIRGWEENRKKEQQKQESGWNNLNLKL